MFRGFYQAVGSTDERGVLRVTQDLNDFLRKHPSKRVIVKVSVYDRRSTQAIMGYYLKVIVPSFRDAMYEQGQRMTYKTVEEWLRNNSVTCTEPTINYDTGEISEGTKELKDLTAEEWIEYIEELKQTGAEDFGIYIEDGRIL